MNLKRRKTVNFIYMCSMGLGLVILTVTPGISGPKVDKVQQGDAAATQVLSLRSDILYGGPSAAQLNEVLSAVLTPTPIPSPTPFPVYALEEKGYPSAIDQLIQTYYQAKINCDMDTLKSISSEPSAVIDEDSLKKLIEGIDDYINLTCYVKKSYREDEYIVWVYHDIKFIGLKTCAPALSKLYVVKDSKGDYKIFDGAMSAELKEYFDSRSQDTDVLELMTYTDNLAVKAQETDKALSAYWSGFDNNGAAVVKILE